MGISLLWIERRYVGLTGRDNRVRSTNEAQELIKVKGLQVAPAELEALLLDHPDVQDAAVIGVTMSVSLPPLPLTTSTLHHD
jgi:4-coumarate--CoA ligase